MTHLRYPLLAASSLLLISACAPTKSADLNAQLQNPLYAKQYYDAQVDDMVNFLIESGSILKDASVKAQIDKTRIEGLGLAKKAHDLRNKGLMGTFMSDTEDVQGDVLVLDGTMYTGPEFVMHPGVDVHVYISTVLDPRNAAFPDTTAVDMGAIHTAFGATAYAVPASVSKPKVVVLYDKALKRIVGFAQLSSIQ